MKATNKSKVEIGFVGNALVMKDLGNNFVINKANYLTGSVGVSQMKKLLKGMVKNSSSINHTQKKGEHSVLSVVGNGRWRDRGISSSLMFKLVSSPKIMKELTINLKATDLGFEPVIETQSLQRMLSNVKNSITVDDNQITATLAYKDVEVKLNIEEYTKIKSYL